MLSDLTFPVIVQLSSDVWFNASNLDAIEDHTDYSLDCLGDDQKPIIWTVIKLSGGKDINTHIPAADVVVAVNAQTLVIYEKLLQVAQRVKRGANA